MPDIAMCTNQECPLKAGCYRSRATPSCWQSYSGFSPNDKGECEYYWPTYSQQERDKQRAALGNKGDK